MKLSTPLAIAHPGYKENILKKKRPQNATVTEGENVTLACNASGNPTPSISWTKNGSAVNSPRIRLSSDKKQLTITNVNRDDKGEYRCVANNSIGAVVSSNAAVLDVQCK